MAAQAPPEQKVMVAIDESEFSHYALEWALRNLQPRHLVLLTVQQLSPLSYVPAGSPLGLSVASPDLIRAVCEHQRQLAQALLVKAKAICADHGVEAETVIEVGDPKESVCESAEKLKVDLLVLGSHSRGPVQRFTSTEMYYVVALLIVGTLLFITLTFRFFLGSVSNYCTHNAKCPVLVVKKQV